MNCRRRPLRRCPSRQPFRFETLESRVLLSTTLLPFTDHSDLVIDSTRNQLIVVGATGTISRYNIATGQTLPPILLGINAGGSDISPDGQYLYVPSTAVSGTLTLDRVNLDTGAVDVFTKAVSPGLGLYDCAVLSDGRVELTTVGPNQTQIFFKLDPVSHTIVNESALNVAPITHEAASIFVSADRLSAIFMEPKNFSVVPALRDAGGVRLFQLPGGTETQLESNSLPLTVSTTAALNHNGTLYALDLPDGIQLFDQTGTRVSTLTGIHGGLAFSPTDDRLYISNPADDSLAIVNTATASHPVMLAELPLNSDVSNVGSTLNGRIAISPDGTKIFVSGDTGICLVDQPAHAWNSSVAFTAPATVPTHQQITLSATLAPNDANAGANKPTGFVSFYDTFQGTTTLLGYAPVTSGSASFLVSSLSIGQHSVSAVYDGDANFSANAQAQNQSINVTKAAPLLTLSAKDHPGTAFTFSESVNLQATISAAGFAPITGAIALFNNANNQLIGQIVLSGGSGTFLIATPANGSYSVRADFPGNASLSAASTLFSYTVANASTTITLAPLPHDTLLLQAQLDSTFAGTMTGTVSLVEGGHVLLTSPIVNRTATFDLGLLPTGPHSFTAVYSGDTVFNPATSAALTQIVPIATSTFLTANHAVTSLGQTLALTAHVTPGVAGTVTFFDGAATMSTVSVANGIATLSLTPQVTGSHHYAVRFNPGAAYEITTDSIGVTIYQPTVLDLLAVYSIEEAQLMNNDIQALMDRLLLQVQDTNLAFANSDIPVSLRLVSLSAVNYHEVVGGIDTDLSRLADPSDGYMDDVPALRDKVGADLVVLLNASASSDAFGETLGIGYELGQNQYARPDQDQVAFLVVDESDVRGDYVLSHEIGHTLGVSHANDDPGGPGLFPDSYGFRFQVNGITYHDIMAYEPGIPIPYYSNPDVVYKGVHLGVVGQSNAARVITYSAPSVSAYRDAQVFGDITAADGSSISGWVLDTNTLFDAASLRIDVDGVAQGYLHANLPNPDLVPLYGSSEHGFSYSLAGMSSGSHLVSVYAIDAQTGLPQLIGSRTVTANHLGATIAPMTVVAGHSLGSSISFSVLDANNQLATTSHSTLTLSVATGPAGGTIGGTLSAIVINGVATFDDLAFTKAGTYTLQASDGLQSLSAGQITVVADASGSHLALVSGSASVSTAGLGLATGIAIEDQFGNVVTTDHSKVTLKLLAAPTGGTLAGTLVATVTNGIASFPKAILNKIGSYTLSATDTTLPVNTPLQWSQPVQAGATTITVAKPAASYTFGAAVTLSASFKSSSPGTPFAGPVTITDASDTVIGTATLTAAGAAKFNLTTPVPGTYQCRIQYPGDAGHLAATSSPFTLVIAAAKTTTALTTTTSAPVFGQSITLSASVKTTPATAPARSGTVNFYDGTTLLGSVAVNGASVAAFTFTPATVGAHAYKAVYSGEARYLISSSAVVKATVGKVKTLAVLTSSAPSPIPHGQMFDLNVHFTVAAPGASALGGDLVTVKDGSKTLGTLTLDGAGHGSLAGLTFTSSGVHSLTAIYAGDATANLSTSLLLKLTIT